MLQTGIELIWRARFRMGPLKEPIEMAADRFCRARGRVAAGPLRGAWYEGTVPEMLGIYEAQVQAVLERVLRPGDVFFDIGANKGFFTLLASRLVGVSGEVYAFDPLKSNAQRIREVITRNPGSNCRVIEKAVSSVDGTVTFYAKTTDDAMGGLDPFEGARELVVAATTLDSIVPKAAWPRLIKVDVEGAEVAVLQGAFNLLRHSKAPDWIIEVHSASHDRRVRQILSAAGYHIALLPSPRIRTRPYPRHLFGVRERSNRMAVILDDVPSEW